MIHSQDTCFFSGKIITKRNGKNKGIEFITVYEIVLFRLNDLFKCLNTE